MKEPLREIEEVFPPGRRKARRFKQAARFARRKKLRIHIDRTSLHNRSRDRVPGIVFYDATKAPRAKHPPHLIDQKRSVPPMHMMQDTNGSHEIKRVILKWQLD
jgi:hypothetical protein